MNIVKNVGFEGFCGVKFGHYQQAKTGLSVFLLGEGMPVGVHVSGGGPASREIELCKPLTAADKIHAILLSGGSAFGLAAANGVMDYLVEQKIGVDVGGTIVPLVAQADIFDLHFSEGIYPQKDWAYQAAKHARELVEITAENIGVATGATVGKLAGNEFASKTKLGIAALALGEIRVGAVVVVNALGDIVDEKAEILAGQKDQSGNFADSKKSLYEARDMFLQQNQNTTLAIIFSNCEFAKVELCKIAAVASQGMARAIRPVATSMDGDLVFAVSTGKIKAANDIVATLAADALEEAIHSAVIQ